MDKPPVYDESSSATESESNGEDEENSNDDDDSGSEGMVIDEQEHEPLQPQLSHPPPPKPPPPAPSHPSRKLKSPSTAPKKPSKPKPKLKSPPLKSVSPQTQSNTKQLKSPKVIKKQASAKEKTSSNSSMKSPPEKTQKVSPKVKTSSGNSTNTTTPSAPTTKVKSPAPPLSPPVLESSGAAPLTSSPSSHGSKKKLPTNTRSLMLTGRGVTTQMLIEQQILEPGEKLLSINYLGRKFVGDLISDGTIKCHSADQIFSSPSSWAMHCKKQVNPDKKSGCGWASVRYKGRKLDEFKSTWFRKQKIEQQVAASSENDSMSSSPFSIPIHPSSELPHASPLSKPTKQIAPESSSSSGYVPPTENYVTFSEALKAVQSRQSTNFYSKMKTEPVVHSTHHHHPLLIDNPHKARKRAPRTRISVKHSLVQPNSDPTTLVECAQFTSTGKIQPFSITISTSAMLLIDFHCHLTTSEVSGYLAGKWDVNRQHIRVTQAFPCRYIHTSTDMEIDKVETEIRNTIESSGLMVLGWYHSHPFCQPDPSLRDIKAQLEYQKALRDGHYEPCVGLIVSPYDSYRKESQFNAFWVREPFDGKVSSVGLPLLMKFTTHQDQALTQDLVNQMVALVNYYQGSVECVKFSEIWSADSTYLDKLKHSVIRKFPQDQTDGRFLDFIHKMLMAVCG